MKRKKKITSKLLVKDTPNLKTYLLIIILLLFFGIYFQFDAFKNNYIVNDDSRIHLLPYLKIQNPDLFTNDYFFSDLVSLFNPIGYNILFSIIATSFDIILFSKILSLILFVLVGIYLFQIGLLIKDKYFAYLLTFFFSFYIWTFVTLSGANPRAFAYPLIIAFLYYLMSEKYFLVCIVLLLELLFYPPAFLISIIIYSLKLINIKNFQTLRKFKLNKEILSYLITLFLCVILLIVITYKYNNPIYGESFNKKDIESMDVFSKDGGRFKTYPYDSIFSLVLKYSYLPFLLSLFSLIMFNKKYFHLNKIIYFLFISGIIMYFLSIFFADSLHYYDRYIRYTMPLFFSIIGLLGLYFLINKFNTFFFSNKQKTKYMLLWLTLLLLYVLTFNSFNKDLIDCSQDKELYSFLQTKPNDIQVVGLGQKMDCIPLYANRKVLFNYEFLQPVAKTQYLEMLNRTNAFTTILYSNISTDIFNFCSIYEVDYILLSEDLFSEKGYNKALRYLPKPFEENLIKNKIYMNSSFLKNEIIYNDNLTKIEDIFIYKCKYLKS
jgi:hypothetical protein